MEKGFLKLGGRGRNHKKKKGLSGVNATSPIGSNLSTCPSTTANVPTISISLDDTTRKQTNDMTGLDKRLNVDSSIEKNVGVEARKSNESLGNNSNVYLWKLEANVFNDADYDIRLPLASVHEAYDRMKNSLYGYFIDCPKAPKRVENRMDTSKGQILGPDGEGFIKVKLKKSDGSNGVIIHFKSVLVKPKTQYWRKDKQSVVGTAQPADTNKALTFGYNKESPRNKCNGLFSLSNSFEALNVYNLIIKEVATGSKVTTSGMQEEGNMDHACAIARSIFVTNFPDSTSSKDLWKLCQSYGTVVDVYIPNRRSKVGKRFAFVWFIKVDNVDRLMGNLCTLWIGRMHLHANVVRFERTPSQVPRPSQPVRKAAHTGNTFASVVKGNLVSPMSLSPALVLDDTYSEDKDYENCGEADNVVEGSVLHNDDEESDTEAVSDTYFGDNVVNVDNEEVQGQEKDFGNPTVNVEVSFDPFNIYGLLNNRKKDNGTAGLNTTPSFPPGFTPEVRRQGHYDNGNHNVVNVVDTNASPCKSVGSNTRIAKEVGNVEGNLYTDNRRCGFKLKESGSILDILDEMIKVGQTMGFSMDGCTKDMEVIIGAQGENVVFR
nr:RNA-directed DNA polymerase, eukaryota, nucleotide-binding alpha-beta plait domain protein [Tanacetum cinerariifolium]